MTEVTRRSHTRNGKLVRGTKYTMHPKKREYQVPDEAYKHYMRMYEDPRMAAMKASEVAHRRDKGSWTTELSDGGINAHLSSGFTKRDSDATIKKFVGEHAKKQSKAGLTAAGRIIVGKRNTGQYKNVAWDAIKSKKGEPSPRTEAAKLWIANDRRKRKK